MLDTRYLINMARSLMLSTNPQKTTIANLKIRTFHHAGRILAAVQQHPAYNTYWAKLARGGRTVVQFKDTKTNQYVGVYVNGKIHMYKGVHSEHEYVGTNSEA